MRRLFLLVFIALLAGCYGSNLGLNPRDDDDDDDSAPDDDDDDDDDATADDDDVTEDDDDATADDDDSTPTDDDDVTENSFEIKEIDPDEGSAEGGYNAEIFYTGDLSAVDEGDVIVRFGSTYTDVLAITAEKLLVEVPPGCSPGELDVEVIVPDVGEDDVEFTFETWADGLDGAIFGIYKSGSPAYPGTDVGSVELGWFEPESSPPLTHLPPLGTCSYNVVSPDNNRNYFSVGSSVSVAASQTIPVTISPDTTYQAANLNPAVLPSSASYTIYGATDPDGCSMPHDSVVWAPPALTVITPLITSQELADCWWLDGGVGVVEWLGPYDVNAQVFMTVTDPGSGASITCHGQDNGVFVVPNQYLLGLAPGELHSIAVTRYRVTTSTLERSGATAYGVFAETETGLLFVMLSAQQCGF